MPESILNSAEDSTSSAEAEVSQMTGSSSLLDNLVIASPCSVSWDTMNLTEDERKRLCKQCDKHVYDLSGMTSDEAESLLRTGGDKICVNFYQRPDGRVMTDDCPAALRALKKRYRKIASLLVGLLASLFNFSPVKAQSPPRLGGKPCVRVPDTVNNKIYDQSVYGKKNVDKLYALSGHWLKTTPKQGILRVTVGSSGKVEDCVVLRSTGDVKNDNLLVNEIKKTRLSVFSKTEKRKFLLLDFSRQKEKKGKKSTYIGIPK